MKQCIIAHEYWEFNNSFSHAEHIPPSCAFTTMVYEKRLWNQIKIIILIAKLRCTSGRIFNIIEWWIIEVEYWDFVLSYLHTVSVPVSCASLLWRWKRRWGMIMKWIQHNIFHHRSKAHIRKDIKFIRMHHSTLILGFHSFIFIRRKRTSLVCRRWGIITKSVRHYISHRQSTW